MARIRIKVEGSIDKALRQFKRKCIDAGIFNELKRVAFYEKPSETRRKAELKKERTIQNLTRKTPLKPKLDKLTGRPIRGPFAGRPR
ncbi:MAG: 30S ribosomal protein S21 [Planctomycetes bacterium]|nr:30S ribosomal protein S21 [Planctomycetota bacterium]